MLGYSNFLKSPLPKQKISTLKFLDTDPLIYVKEYKLYKLVNIENAFDCLSKEY
jgi:hypothetical protein